MPIDASNSWYLIAIGVSNESVSDTVKRLSANGAEGTLDASLAFVALGKGDDSARTTNSSGTVDILASQIALVATDDRGGSNPFNEKDWGRITDLGQELQAGLEVGAWVYTYKPAGASIATTFTTGLIVEDDGSKYYISMFKRDPVIIDDFLNELKKEMNVPVKSGMGFVSQFSGIGGAGAFGASNYNYLTDFVNNKVIVMGAAGTSLSDITSFNVDNATTSPTFTKLIDLGLKSTIDTYVTNQGESSLQINVCHKLSFGNVNSTTSTSPQYVENTISTVNIYI